VTKKAFTSITYLTLRRNSSPAWNTKRLEESAGMMLEIELNNTLALLIRIRIT
jgi:hypothetical protein